jgi:hypothetical protein
MVTLCCHGNVKSSDYGLKLLFYIRGNNGLCNHDYTIKWPILKHAISYTEESKRCKNAIYVWKKIKTLHFERHKQRQFTQ